MCVSVFVYEYMCVYMCVCMRLFICVCVCVTCVICNMIFVILHHRCIIIFAASVYQRSRVYYAMAMV